MEYQELGKTRRARLRVSEIVLASEFLYFI
jgi:hypothetical protein